MEEYPEVTAHLTADGNFRVQCPYCGRPHTHGGGGPGVTDRTEFYGHRLAHCSDVRVPPGTGYILVPKK